MGWLRPDSKTQVTVEYNKEASGAVTPLRVDTVVISTQHAEEITTEDLRTQIYEKIIKKVIPKNLLDDRVIYHIQPSGRFVIGGPQGDAGLTGRKIIVDTYGGWGAHGGGAFSGKDWSKVDRSAAYTARWIAKSLSFPRVLPNVPLSNSPTPSVSQNRYRSSLIRMGQERRRMRSWSKSYATTSTSDQESSVSSPIVVF